MTFLCEVQRELKFCMFEPQQGKARNGYVSLPATKHPSFVYGPSFAYLSFLMHIQISNTDYKQKIFFSQRLRQSTREKQDSNSQARKTEDAL